MGYKFNDSQQVQEIYHFGCYVCEPIPSTRIYPHYLIFTLEYKCFLQAPHISPAFKQLFWDNIYLLSVEMNDAFGKSGSNRTLKLSWGWENFLKAVIYAICDEYSKYLLFIYVAAQADAEVTDSIDWLAFPSVATHDDHDNAKNSWSIPNSNNFRVRSRKFHFDRSKVRI